MKNIWIILLLITASLFHVDAQKRKSPPIVTISGTGQVRMERTMSRSEAEKNALERAIINALEQEFGSIVVQGNSTYIKNTTTSERVESQTCFNMIANTTVAGDVIEILNKEFDEVTGIDSHNEKITDINCKVRLKARKKIQPPVEFEAYPLGCENKKCKTFDFHDNDDFFVYFRSPVSGYLTIFLDDTKDSFRLLPYQQMSAEFEGGMPVKADMEYILFSQDSRFNYFDDPDFQEDTYQLTAENAQDMNRLFIIFSRDPLHKANMNTNLRMDKLSPSDLEQGFSVPSSLESENFQRWLIKNNSLRTDIQTKPIDISISK